LAALMQALFLAGAALALALVFQAVQRLIRPEPLDAVELGLWVTGAATAAAGGLVVMQSWVLRQTPSTAIAADRTHYLADVAVNVTVLAALAVTTLTGWQRADPVFALAISTYMLWNARGIAVEALRQLLDRELPANTRERIKEVVLAVPEARALHDLRSRDAGDRVFVEFHLEVDGGLPVAHGHSISDRAEAEVRNLFPEGSEVTVHIEPAGIRDKRLDDEVHRNSL
jgi:cation diffusion facilitator family transporter